MEILDQNIYIYNIRLSMATRHDDKKVVGRRLKTVKLEYANVKKKAQGEGE